MSNKSKIKNVFIDLDGTLLPMDFDVFLNAYINAVSNKAQDIGLEKELFKKGLWAGVYKMMLNDGKALNEEVYWQAFTSVTGVSKNNVDLVLKRVLYK